MKGSESLPGPAGANGVGESPGVLMFSTSLPSLALRCLGVKDASLGGPEPILPPPTTPSTRDPTEEGPVPSDPHPHTSLPVVGPCGNTA